MAVIWAERAEWKDQRNGARSAAGGFDFGAMKKKTAVAKG